MTKVALQTMIAALKDRCKSTMDSDFKTSSCGYSAASVDRTTIFSIGYEQSLSLSAMVAYVAHTTGRSEYRIERDLSNHFCVPNPKCLSKDQYEAAIRYMVEQVPAHRC